MMKAQEEWGPADYAVSSMTRGGVMAVTLLVAGAVSYGAASAVTDKLADYRGWKEVNHRGFIGCVDGHIEMRNIDFVDLAAPIELSEIGKGCSGGVVLQKIGGNLR